VVKVQEGKLSELVPDDRNANKGTERGRYMLETSLEQVGAGRGIVVDKHGKVIAGNKTQEVAIASGIEDAIIVETDGRQLVVTKRLDMDLDDPDPNNPARKYAYLDNRAGEVGLAWDGAQMALDLESGFDFDGMFRDLEIDSLLAPLEIVDDGEFSDGHKMRGGREINSIVVGFGRFAAPLDKQLADDAATKIKQRWGEEPDVALVALCEWIINEVLLVDA